MEMATATIWRWIREMGQYQDVAVTPGAWAG